MFIAVFFCIGLGLSCSLFPSLICVKYHFERYRSVALGIGLSGSPLGTVALTPLIALAIQYYGWRGAMMLVAGFSFQSLISAALMRPPPANRNEDKADDSKSALGLRDVHSEQNSESHSRETDQLLKKDKSILCAIDCGEWPLLNIPWIMFQISTFFVNFGFTVMPRIFISRRGHAILHTSPYIEAAIVMVMSLADFLFRLLSGFIGSNESRRIGIFIAVPLIGGLANLGVSLFNTIPLLFLQGLISNLSGKDDFVFY